MHWAVFLGLLANGQRGLFVLMIPHRAVFDDISAKNGGLSWLC